MRNTPRNKAIGPPIVDRDGSESESDELMLVKYRPHVKRPKQDVQEGASVLLSMIVDHNPRARAWDEGVEGFFAFVQGHHGGLKSDAFDKTRLDIPLACTETPENTVVLISPLLSAPENRPVIPTMPSSPEDNWVIPSPVLPSSSEDDLPSDEVIPEGPGFVIPSPTMPSSPESGGWHGAKA